jgi:hypothetical protein
MKSVVDALRAETISHGRTRTAAERVGLALALGRRDVRLLAAAKSIAPSEARRAIGAQRQRGRRPSTSHQGLSS